MKRVEGVEDLNICSISAQGIVGVGVIIRISTSSCRAAGCHSMARAGCPAAYHREIVDAGIELAFKHRA
jgi:hypothetical protein